MCSSLNGAESLTRADKAEWAGASASASLRAERKALWRDSDTVPEAGIDDKSFYNDTRRKVAQKISGRDGLYGEEP